MSTLSKRSTLLATSCFLTAAVCVYLSVKKTPETDTPAPQSTEGNSRYSSSDLPPNRPLRNTAAQSLSGLHDAQLPPTALPNERILVFDDDAAYRRFLSELASRGLRRLGQSDPLRAVRVGIGPDSRLDDLQANQTGFNFIVRVPRPPQASAQEGALGFGQGALQWLGINTDNSHWGQGVTVAVIDSGVNQHPALEGNTSQIELAALSAGSSQLSHGTAVASIISGDHQLTPGVAPSADILSIRVSDETGYSNSFTLAEGIVRAVDSGAEIINISMGSYGDSRMVSDAVDYATERGAVIVASSGNEGLDNLAYPAAYEKVISVGAVEQGGEHLDFSNSHSSLDITAPGYQVNAAWGDEQLTAFSGTSASAPFVSGAIAATMSENPNLSAQQAAEQVLCLTSDAGLPGQDTQYGGGVLDLGQIMQSDTPGIYDAAVTAQHWVPADTPGSLPQVWVTVQNQGTETLINSPVEITTPEGTQQLNVSSLTPGAIQTFQIPLKLPFNGDPAVVRSSVGTQETDIDPGNNSKTESFSREAP